ncbi:MAG: DUF362 domain-containing protein [Methanobacterium sp.]
MTTHPSIIEAIIKSVKELEAVPIVGDSPGGPFGNIKRYWDLTGIEEVCRRHDVKIVIFNQQVFIKKF